MAWFKRCKHAWYETVRYFNGYGATCIYVYCPKCGKRKTFGEIKFERQKAEQRIKEAFERMNGGVNG